MDTILDRFEDCARRFPDKIAFTDQEKQITFRRLQDEAQRIALGIINLGLFREPVGVLAQHSVNTVILFLAVLYSGNFYIPLDEDAPSERIQMIVQNSGMRLLLGYGERSVNGIYCCTAEQLAQKTENNELLGKVRKAIMPIDPLYAVYTSGSTGIPKGVVKSHLAVIHFVESFTKRFPLDSEEVLGNQTPFYFDASSKDIYFGLLLGLTVHIIDKKLFSIPLELIRYLNERKISTICWSPSALMILSQLNAFRAAVPDCLKRVFFVGEVFLPKQLARWKAALPGVEFVNLYGSSEIAGVCTSYIIPDDYREEDVPLGTPLPDMEVFLLEKQGDSYVRVEESGQEGEICVRGGTIGLGYLNDPERTAEVFIQNPFVKGFRDIVYRSGDLGKYDEQGNLYYVSRSDFQIKHMGYRIELPEIEAKTNCIEGVRKSACVYDRQKKWILLFVEAEPGSSLSAASVIDSLKLVLPMYMVPRKVQILDEIPMNANGKIDRVRLLEEFVPGRAKVSERKQ